MAQNIKDIKKDRLRYTKNTLSSSMTYIAILFNVLYFVNIYQSDVGNYYYTITTGISVLTNLVFLLVAFLSSEGLKSYKPVYAYVIIGVGAIQIARIFGIPMIAHTTKIVLGEEETLVMDDAQFNYVLICLIISAVACFIAGFVGLYKTITLNNYVKEQGLE